MTEESTLKGAQFLTPTLLSITSCVPGWRDRERQWQHAPTISRANGQQWKVGKKVCILAVLALWGESY